MPTGRSKETFTTWSFSSPEAKLLHARVLSSFGRLPMVYSVPSALIVAFEKGSPIRLRFVGHSSRSVRLWTSRQRSLTIRKIRRPVSWTESQWRLWVGRQFPLFLQPSCYFMISYKGRFRCLSLLEIFASLCVVTSIKRNCIPWLLFCSDVHFQLELLHQRPILPFLAGVSLRVVLYCRFSARLFASQPFICDLFVCPNLSFQWPFHSASAIVSALPCDALAVNSAATVAVTW